MRWVSMKDHQVCHTRRCLSDMEFILKPSDVQERANGTSQWSCLSKECGNQKEQTPACAGVCCYSSEADENRTRNLRIDSPGL